MSPPRPPSTEEQEHIDELAARYGLKRISLPAHLLGACELSGDVCPECGAALRMESGCAVCPQGCWSKCG